MLKIQSLASGSSGNAAVVASENTTILVDAGLTCAELINRLNQVGVDPRDIDAVVLTHEHDDHIKGLGAFHRRFGTPMFFPRNAHQCFLRKVGIHDASRVFKFEESVDIDEIHVTAFEVPHDSRWCYGYTFRNGNAKFALATDLGECSDESLAHMFGCQVVMLESNYDTDLLQRNVKYPDWLKRRITGANGHMSNTASARAIYKLSQMGVQQIICAHLSRDNNSPNIAFDTIRTFLDAKGVIEGRDIHIDIATQDSVGNVFEID